MTHRLLKELLAVATAIGLGACAAELEGGTGHAQPSAPTAPVSAPPTLPEAHAAAGSGASPFVVETSVAPPPAAKPMTALPPVTPPPAPNTAPPTTAAPSLPTAMGSGEPRIPAKQGECPTLATGNVTLMGQKVQLWVGQKQPEKKAPIMFYWHGTGSFAGEAAMLGSALTEIQQSGGMVASFDTTTKMGQNTGNNVWYTGDFAMTDQLLACAVEQLNIDTHRIYTAGCSAGGLQVGSMVYVRSSYVAAAMTNSGGIVFPFQLEDPTHVPALITAHGKMGTDVVVIDFSTTSATQTKDIAAKKGYAVDCDHGGGHCAAPGNLVAAQWEFLKAHPFGVTEDPYATGLPASFPSYCQIIK